MDFRNRVSVTAFVVIAVLACAPAAPDRAQVGDAGSTAEASASQAPPAPAPVPKNRCLARALVAETRPIDGEDRPGSLPPEAAGRPLQALVLAIETSRRTASTLANLCVPDTRVEAFGTRRDDDSLVGHDVEVELELIGDSDHRLWWLHDLKRRPPGDSR